MTGDRYGAAPRKRPSQHDADYWHRNGRAVILSVLNTHHAVTVSELESRAADRVWDPTVCPYPIDPHWLTNVRNELADAGLIESTSAPTRSHPQPITTWSLPPARGRRSRIVDAAARKRLLTARHDGWSERGGAGHGLIGRAGENALAKALDRAECPLSGATGPTTTVLGVDVSGTGLGEIDDTAFCIDQSEPGAPQLIQVIVEVKNTRPHYYASDVAVLRFLAKAAVVQQARPRQLILPVFLCRRFQYTLWELSQAHGFLPAMVENQLVLSDHENTPERFAEVRAELYADLVLGDRPTNRHLGTIDKAIPRRALPLARLWQHHHAQYLPRGRVIPGT